jgi:hypothetical protein
MRDYAAMEERHKVAKSLELEHASSYLQTLSGSHTGSEEAEYARFNVKPLDIKSVDGGVGNDVKPTRMTERSAAKKLKEPPSYVNVVEAEYLATLEPIKKPEAEPGVQVPYIKSPMLKSLQVQGIASDAIPALPVVIMGMMDQLAKSVSALTAKGKQIESKTNGPERPRKKAEPQLALEAIKSTPEGPNDSCYAIGFGRDNRSGVFSTWAEAAPLVFEVSGTIHAKCRSWKEAQAFVEATQTQLKKKRSKNPEGFADSNVWYAVVNNKTQRTGSHRSQWSQRQEISILPGGQDIYYWP